MKKERKSEFIPVPAETTILRIAQILHMLICFHYYFS